MYLNVPAAYLLKCFCRLTKAFHRGELLREVTVLESGTELVGGNVIIQAKMEYKDTREYFGPAGAPWRQSYAESLLKTVKNNLFFAMGRQKP